MQIGAVCLWIAEPLLIVMVELGFVSLIRALYVGGAFALVGTFYLGFGSQRIVKAQRAENKASTPSNQHAYCRNAVPERER